ncbi:MAG: UpxY family transcription antiterminator [Pedobacter sp.]|nr:UpxY family transcription antiterminator [Pedobacter sp.]
MNDYKWYPVYTRSRMEKKVYQELRQKEIIAYLPLKKELKQWSDRKKIVEEPLIKSYLFVYITVAQQMEVLQIYGVARFIYFCGKVASMPDKQMEDLKLLLATDDELEIFDFDIAEGEKVLIKAGPFKDIVGEVVSIKNKIRVVLRLKNMGYAININTSMAFLELLNDTVN